MFLWFSKKQLDFGQSTIPRRKRFFGKLNATGKIVEYTVVSSTMDHECKFNDLVFLGEGEYDHYM